MENKAVIKVAKFGGSSLADAEHFVKVKNIIIADSSRRYVVPSAPGKRFEGDSEFLEHDQIMIPYVDLNVLINYSELCDKVIKGTDGDFIRNAIEDVKFSLNENGVNLKSESVIQTTMMSSYKDARYFLFNDKFVLFLKECDKEKPYFAIKINNIEFLEKDI